MSVKESLRLGQGSLIRYGSRTKRRTRSVSRSLAAQRIRTGRNSSTAKIAPRVSLQNLGSNSKQHAVCQRFGVQGSNSMYLRGTLKS